MRVRTAVAVMVVLAVGLAFAVGRATGDRELAGNGEANDTGDGWQEQPGDVVAAGALVAFDACDELLAYTTEHALELVGPWGLGGGYGGFGEVHVDFDVDDAGDGAEVAARAAAPVEGVDFSGTNIQETGVDEPDSVKTDGRRIFVIRGQRLHVVDITGDAPELLATVDLGGWGNELLLSGDRLLVMGTADGDMRPMPFAEGRAIGGWHSGAQLSLYDVADPAAPEQLATLDLDGWVVSARMIDGVARVVLRAEPVGLDFSYPEGSGLRAEREATERNRDVIRASTVENWVPYYVHSAAGRQTEGTLLGCERVHHPREFAGLGTTSVLSLDLAGDLGPQGATGVLAGGDTVYASTDRLYVATNRWFDWEALTDRDAREASERYTTDLHAFDITRPEGARYVGSGSVRGHVLNQWAMSAHDGVLRVATTEGSPWWGWRGGEEEAFSESFVTTFAESGGELRQVGQVGGLGLDERIYAVRYMGDIAYVVTFRETDPLYTLDLSDPAAPEVLGELKIMGYSAYLHPVAEGLLLGVGQDADERGMVQGLQLSLFDVSDLADPQRIHQVTLPDTHSGAEWDHRAFLHWPATGLTVIPYETWRWEPAEDEREDGVEEATNGALGYTLDRASGFAEVGRVTHLPEDVVDSRDPRFYDVVWRAPVRRSMVIGDHLYTLSDLGVKASDLSTLSDAGWLALP